MKWVIGKNIVHPTYFTMELALIANDDGSVKTFNSKSEADDFAEQHGEGLEDIMIMPKMEAI